MIKSEMRNPYATTALDMNEEENDR
jgi:hypothetical protein